MMWAHYENGVNYLDARICIASCDTPDGDLLSPSYCTGWAPNQGKWSVGDRWNYHYYKEGEERLSPLEHMKAYYCQSSFVILPIHFDGERPYIEYAEAFDTEAFN